MKKIRLVLPLFAALAALPALVALFAPEARSAPCQGSVDEARRHMERGFELYDAKQYLEAAAEFDAAYRAQPFSAFLCNAAMAYQAANDFQNAIQRFEAFLKAEPNAPDLARIKINLAWLVAQDAARRAAHADAGPDAAAASTLADADAGAPPPPVELAKVVRSQILVVSEPAEAPVTIWSRKAGAPPFVPGSPNPGWEKVGAAAKTPHDLSLGPGDYHVVIDAFKDYKRVETDFSLQAGHVYELKAMLSQGEFLGFLRVLSPAKNARIWLDDPPPHQKPPWGRAPHGALVQSGAHQIWIEAPGYEPATEKLTIEHGKTLELTPVMERVRYGYLRIDGNADEVTVKIDGARRGLYSPLGEPLRIRLPSGSHKLELSAGGRKTYLGDVEVPRGQELSVHGRLSFAPARSSAVVSGALAVGAIVGGVVLFKQAAAPQDTASLGTAGNAPSSAPTWFRVGGAVSFGVGALLGASTVYSIVNDPTPPSTLRTDKPKDLDESDLDVPGGYVPGPRGRVLGDEARAEPRCGAL